MDLSNIRTVAERYCHSYSQAVGLGATESAATDKIAEAIFSHYLQDGFVNFALGFKVVMGDKEAMMPKMKLYMDKWVQHGLGLDIRMDKYRIEALSPGNALCFITWSIHPPTGSSIEGWNWENVYSYRVPYGQDKGHWDFCISDNETAGLLQRFPDFMEGMES